MRRSHYGLTPSLAEQVKPPFVKPPEVDGSNCVPFGGALTHVALSPFHQPIGIHPPHCPCKELLLNASASVAPLHIVAPGADPSHPTHSNTLARRAKAHFTPANASHEAAHRSKSAPHMHVLVYRCSNVRQFKHRVNVQTQTLLHICTAMAVTLEFRRLDRILSTKTSGLHLLHITLALPFGLLTAGTSLANHPVTQGPHMREGLWLGKAHEGPHGRTTHPIPACLHPEDRGRRWGCSQDKVLCLPGV